ncbi:uncharacterized protein [Cicer arietinum]|uniref:Uncharacterized protein LOC101503482 n=1 Tax=Cicer arietinum TaxID=3827 RepID=A0A1S2XUK7_CICAR|nr:uncharacterized protein LOC101503482 [Cicer arietinum]
MSSVCISNCINDARDPRVPVRATYVNLYKWPESDAAFVRSVSSDGREKGGEKQHPRVVDSISCRQLFLRSYTFCRDDEKKVMDKTQKCFGRRKVKVKVKVKAKAKAKERVVFVGKKNLGWKKVKEISCSALFSIFRRFLSCCASVDVVDENYHI